MTASLLAASVDAYREAAAGTTAEIHDITIGPRAILVEAAIDSATGDESFVTAGLAHRPRGDSTDFADYGVDSLLAAATQSVDDDAGTSTAARPTDASATVPPELRGVLPRAVGLATLNALSAPFLEWTAGDPMERLDDGVERITTVGLFAPAFRKFDDVEVRIVERTPVGDLEHPPDVSVSVFDPADAAAAFAGSDVAFITGSTLIYGGLERYLGLAADATVVLIGASASCCPGALFDAGVDLLAGAAVVDPAAARREIRRGGCGTDLHEAGVRKGYLAADPAEGRLRLTDTPTHQ